MTEELTHEELQSIRTWDSADPQGWLEFVMSLWTIRNLTKSYGYAYYFDTGNLPTNNDIIYAMQSNIPLWDICWSSSRRGGHHVFEVPYAMLRKQ